MKRYLVILFCLLCNQSIHAQVHKYINISFEEINKGTFTEIHTNLYTLLAKGHSVQLDIKHSRNGKKALRILGGTDNKLILIPKSHFNNPVLSFFAQRWTKKKPFVFRVDKYSDGKWEEIFNGDKQIKTGRFVPITLKIIGRVEQLRFRCTSYRGVLIDDIFLGTPTNMSIISLETGKIKNPVLIGKPVNFVTNICINTQGILHPLKVKTIIFNISGCTDINDIEDIKCFYSDSNELSAKRTQFGKTLKPHAKIIFAGNQELNIGKNYFWLSFKIKNNTPLNHFFYASCKNIQLDNGENISPPASNVRQKTGYALRRAGQDGVHTYRIPGLATTNCGTLIAVYDVRYRSKNDLPGDIDIGMSRSTDKGKTWSPMHIIIDMGNNPEFLYDGVGDPCILVDRVTGTIWVAALWAHGNRGWRYSKQGITPKETGQLILVRSDDDGKTWSKPINITQQLKKPDWYLMFDCPGKGITMSDGTIVFPAQYLDESKIPYSTIIYSKNHGKTWHIGTGAKPNTTEAQVVELSDGVLMLNMRDNRGGARSVCITKDMGKTWIEHRSSRKSLPEPICMASLIKVDVLSNGTKKRLLLFSNPNSTMRRENLTIKVSEDDGNTWPERYYTVVDSRLGFGYSCMTVIDSETIGILYEGIRELYFVEYKLNELLKRGN